MGNTNKFSKAALLKSARFNKRRDLLKVLLKDGETYSIAEVESLLEKKLKRKVN